MRAIMVWVPGFSDHLPTDYLEALQHEHALQTCARQTGLSTS